MKLPWIPVVLACLAVAACNTAPLPAPPSPSPGGWMRVSEAPTKQIACGELPVLVDISHATITLTGMCGYVRVIGEHLDVVVDIIAGGTIDITGAHDDVYWKQSTPGVRPSLLDNGPNNTFHPPR
jgi:hypothetical protein